MTAPEHDPSTFHRPAFLALGWSTVGTAVMFGANLVALVVLSRLIDPAAFGVIAIASAIGFIVKMLGVFPLLQATIQANCPNDLRGATNLAWTVAGVSAIVILVVAAPLASVFGIEQSRWVLSAWSPIILFQGVSVPARALLQHGLRFRELTIVQVVSSLIGLAIIPIALALNGMGLGALYLAFFSQALLDVVGLSIVVRKLFVPRRGESNARELARGMRDYSLLYTVSAASTQGDNLIVAAFLGDQALGYYSRAYRLMSLPANMFGDAVDSVLFPLIVRTRENTANVARGIRLANLLLALVVLPLSAISIVLAEPIIMVALGRRWLSAVPAFQIFSIGMFFRVAIKPFGSALRGLGAQRRLTAVWTVYGVAVVVFSIIGQHWGIEGAAVGVVCALAVTYVLVSCILMRLIASAWLPLLEGFGTGLVVALLSGLAAWATSSVVGTAPVAVRLGLGTLAGLVPASVALFLPKPRRAVASALLMRRPSKPRDTMGETSLETERQ